MDHYVGMDVSLEMSSVCIVDGTGKIVRETKVASENAPAIGLFILSSRRRAASRSSVLG